MSKQDSLFDRRTVERNIRAGRITRKDYDQYLASLDNVQSKSASLSGEGQPSPEPGDAEEQ